VVPRGAVKYIERTKKTQRGFISTAVATIPNEIQMIEKGGFVGSFSGEKRLKVSQKSLDRRDDQISRRQNSKYSPERKISIAEKKKGGWEGRP